MVPTTIISVLVKADKHANDFQMFLSVLQESRKTEGEQRAAGVRQRKTCSKKNKKKNPPPKVGYISGISHEKYPLPLLTAFRKRVKGYLHIECTAVQDSVPLYCFRNGGTALEVEYPGATVPCRLLRYSQPSVLETKTMTACLNTAVVANECLE